MRKLAIAAALLLVVLLVLWRQLDDSSATPAVAKTDTEVAAAPTAKAPDIKLDVKPSGSDAVAEGSGSSSGKQVMDAGSELFTKHFIDVIPKRLWKEAAVCYEGKLGSRHRNSKIKYAFNVVVKNGTVTIKDFKIANSTDDEDLGKPVNTINDPAIESCFFKKLSGYTWNGNDDMPEGYTIPDYTYPDELVIRPERSTKYYESNMNYVGGEAPNKGGHATTAPRSK
jgi:hypothetical protein